MFKKSLFVITILTLSLGISTPAKAGWFSDLFGGSSSRAEKKERLEKNKRERERKEKERREKDDSLKYDGKTSGLGRGLGEVAGTIAGERLGGEAGSNVGSHYGGMAGDALERETNRYSHNRWNKRDKRSTTFRSMPDDE